jgi:hypothetical protein
MIKKTSLQTSIQTIISILILMTLFVVSVYAASCHDSEQGISRFNQKPIITHGILSAGAAVEASVVQYKGCQHCMVICSAQCNPKNIPVESLLISSNFKNKQSVDILKTKYFFDSELEDTHKNIKLQNHCRSSYSTSPSKLHATLKHRVLLI